MKRSRNATNKRKLIGMEIEIIPYDGTTNYRNPFDRLSYEQLSAKSRA